MSLPSNRLNTLNVHRRLMRTIAGRTHTRGTKSAVKIETSDARRLRKTHGNNERISVRNMNALGCDLSLKLHAINFRDNILWSRDFPVRGVNVRDLVSEFICDEYTISHSCQIIVTTQLTILLISDNERAKKKKKKIWKCSTFRKYWSLSVVL